jgi:CheY-like chemotaxis protein
LVVDDEPAVGETLSELLSSYTLGSDSRSITTRFEESFDNAVDLLSNEIFDILVLDIRGGSGPTPTGEAGIEIFNEIRGRRFIPIIFYTALPDVSVTISNAPFVQTVSKIGSEPLADLRVAIENIIGSGLLNLLRSVSSHLDDIERVFMADFVEKNWSSLVERPEDLSYLLSRRLSVSFDEGAERLAQELGLVELTTRTDVVHPTRYYVQPSHSNSRMGDIVAAPDLTEENVAESADADDILYVVLTPSCDLVLRSGRMKADYVVLAECLPLVGFKEYRDWKSARSSGTEDRLRKLLTSRPKGQEDRYFYLPAAWNVPDVVADLQSVTSIPWDELESYRKIASLDSPFAEALSYQFNRYMGRVGTPDLDIAGVMRRLET